MVVLFDLRTSWSSESVYGAVTSFLQGVRYCEVLAARVRDTRATWRFVASRWGSYAPGHVWIDGSKSCQVVSLYGSTDLLRR